LRSPAARRARLASVVYFSGFAWQCEHSGLPVILDTPVVFIRQLEQSCCLAIVVSHHNRGRRERTVARLTPEQVAVVVQVSATMRA
jgi:hypothetical protein